MNVVEPIAAETTAVSPVAKSQLSAEASNSGQQPMSSTDNNAAASTAAGQQAAGPAEVSDSNAILRQVTESAANANKKDNSTGLPQAAAGSMTSAPAFTTYSSLIFRLSNSEDVKLDIAHNATVSTVKSLLLQSENCRKIIADNPGSVMHMSLFYLGKRLGDQELIIPAYKLSNASVVQVMLILRNSAHTVK